jgi:erythronate-4-phosphate dehydrogenase
LKFVVDRNIRGAESTFGRHGELDVMDGRDIRAEHLANADALIIRTATRADRALLNSGSPGQTSSAACRRPLLSSA